MVGRGMKQLPLVQGWHDYHGSMVGNNVHGWHEHHGRMVGSIVSELKTTYMEGMGWFGKPVNLFLHFECSWYLGDRPPRPPGKGGSIR